MQLLQSLALALLAISAGTSAMPSTSNFLSIPISKKRDAFTLPESNLVDFNKTAAHIRAIKSKYRLTLDHFEDNTGKAHPLASTSRSLEKRSTAAISLTGVLNTVWHGAVTIGSSIVQCDFDTGSSDIIVNKGAYTPGTSASKTGIAFTAAYSDGTSTTGSIYKDSVTVAGLEASSVSIGLSSSNYLPTSQGANAICGMSYPSLSVLGKGNIDFVDGLVNSKVVSNNIFTFSLASTGSTLYLGGVDPAAGSPTYINVPSNAGYWTITNSSINGIKTSSIVDTGTSLIVAPIAFAKSIFDSVNATTFAMGGTLYGSYPCNSPPKITYKFGSFSQTLSASTVTMGNAGLNKCVLSIVGEDTGLNAVIAGDAFLRNVHAVFDRSSNRIGFSPIQ